MTKSLRNEIPQSLRSLPDTVYKIARCLIQFDLAKTNEYRGLEPEGPSMELIADRVLNDPVTSRELTHCVDGRRAAWGMYRVLLATNKLR